MNARKVVTSLSLDPQVLETIDKLRGMIPRSRYVEKLIREAMKASK
jgi:metal-responsive CopG/Arc/MetJ family transcriptional regulator